jgi:hypothetical protein
MLDSSLLEISLWGNVVFSVSELEGYPLLARPLLSDDQSAAFVGAFEEAASPPVSPVR